MAPIPQLHCNDNKITVNISISASRTRVLQETCTGPEVPRGRGLYCRLSGAHQLLAWHRLQAFVSPFVGPVGREVQLNHVGRRGCKRRTLLPRRPLQRLCSEWSVMTFSAFVYRFVSGFWGVLAWIYGAKLRAVLLVLLLQLLVFLLLYALSMNMSSEVTIVFFENLYLSCRLADCCFHSSACKLSCRQHGNINLCCGRTKYAVRDTKTFFL